jgi:hypothetical protein
VTEPGIPLGILGILDQAPVEIMLAIASPDWPSLAQSNLGFVHPCTSRFHRSGIVNGTANVAARFHEV